MLRRVDEWFQRQEERPTREYTPDHGPEGARFDARARLYLLRMSMMVLPWVAFYLWALWGGGSAIAWIGFGICGCVWGWFLLQDVRNIGRRIAASRAHKKRLAQLASQTGPFSHHPEDASYPSPTPPADDRSGD